MQAVTLTVHGVLVPIEPSEVSPVIWEALVSGSYEAKEARWIAKCVQPDDRVLELGSGVGIVTALIARVDNVHVWAFEANPLTAALARRVLNANQIENVSLSQGVLTAGAAQELKFYIRSDLWMSSMDEQQGPYLRVIELASQDIDAFIARHDINVLVMDIEGAERDLLSKAELPGVERIFLELHDHLYGLDGIRDITRALVSKGFGYDPRGSSGPCVLFSRDDKPRVYQEEAEWA
nr:FkbM family methyltransferase [Nitratireductor basaltis]